MTDIETLENAGTGEEDRLDLLEGQVLNGDFMGRSLSDWSEEVTQVCAETGRRVQDYVRLGTTQISMAEHPGIVYAIHEKIQELAPGITRDLWELWKTSKIGRE